MHTNQQIMQVFQKTMHLEITNPIKTTPHSICLELPNHQQVLIGIIMTTAPLHNSKPFTLATKCQHTYHYLHQNDGYHRGGILGGSENQPYADAYRLRGYLSVPQSRLLSQARRRVGALRSHAGGERKGNDPIYRNDQSPPCGGGGVGWPWSASVRRRRWALFV